MRRRLMVMILFAFCAPGCDIDLDSKPTAPPSPSTRSSPRPEVRAPRTNYITTYNADRKRLGRDPVFGQDDQVTVGRLPGRYSVVQIISPSSLLVMADDGTTVVSLIDGFDTSGRADGPFIVPGDDLFWYQGTKTYTTVLGATRTANYYTRVDRELISSYDAIVRGNARMKLNKAKTQLADFQKQSKRIADFLSATERIRLYTQHADNPDMAAQLQKERSRLDACGQVTREEVVAYKARLAELQRAVKDAAADITR